MGVVKLQAIFQYRRKLIQHIFKNKLFSSSRHALCKTFSFSNATSFVSHLIWVSIQHWTNFQKVLRTNLAKNNFGKRPHLFLEIHENILQSCNRTPQWVRFQMSKGKTLPNCFLLYKCSLRFVSVGFEYSHQILPANCVIAIPLVNSFDKLHIESGWLRVPETEQYKELPEWPLKLDLILRFEIKI